MTGFENGIICIHIFTMFSYILATHSLLILKLYVTGLSVTFFLGLMNRNHFLAFGLAKILFTQFMPGLHLETWVSNHFMGESCAYI